MRPSDHAPPSPLSPPPRGKGTVPRPGRRDTTQTMDWMAPPGPRDTQTGAQTTPRSEASVRSSWRGSWRGSWRFFQGSDEGPRDTGWSTRPALSERTRLRGVRTSILSVGSQQLSPVTLNRRRLWSLLHQMCIRRSLLVALPCAVVAAVMEHADSQVGFLQSILPDDQTYSSFTFLLGFFLTFHTAHAYQRFWYGAQMIYTISGNFIDMTSLLLAFTRHSDGLEELRSEFKVTLIRLASLLFAVSIEEVTGHQNEEDEISDDYISDKRAIDPRGLDQSMLERALSARHRPQVVCQMIQNLIVDQISNGVLSIPAPILTRAFQEQSNAMIQFHEVRSCSEVPFPFPFVIVSEVLLIVHWVVTPFFMGYWCPGIASAAFYTLVVTLTLWSLHGISMELDNPFGRDSNDIAVQFLQEQLNQQLVTVLIESELGLPKDKLSTSATLVDELLARFERSSGQSLPSIWPKRRHASLRSESAEAESQTLDSANLD